MRNIARRELYAPLKPSPSERVRRSRHGGTLQGGTALAMTHVMGYPVDAAGQVTVYGLGDMPVSDRYFRIELQQYRYDGVRFTVEHTESFEPEALLPGWEFTSMPLATGGLHDGHRAGRRVRAQTGARRRRRSALLRPWRRPHCQGGWERRRQHVHRERYPRLALNGWRRALGIDAARTPGAGGNAGDDLPGGGRHGLYRRESLPGDGLARAAPALDRDARDALSLAAGRRPAESARPSGGPRLHRRFLRAALRFHLTGGSSGRTERTAGRRPLASPACQPGAGAERMHQRCPGDGLHGHVS